MLHQHTLTTLKTLKLPGMAAAFEEQLIQPVTQSLSFTDRFGLIVDREASHRDNQRLGRLLKNARLKHNACVEDIDYRSGRGLDKAVMATLIGCDWIRQVQNLILTGKTGCGKTWLACALGNQACRQGMSVLYVRTSRLLEEMKLAHSDGSFRKRLMQIAKIDLLVLDDWGVSTLIPSERQDLLELIDDRTRKSTLITSQIPVKAWHEVIGEPTLADAILDRIVHRSHTIDLTGESMRKTKKT
ncbi:MAG: IstB-like ATP-binding protein [Candidatus Gallionella acididurans]|uniref:IstB-like ATP-binding protein n=1 Tax=Candidatus Gallionella acididurans TaxID=1796491 RepID=A0A139BSD1_9PROT|nr:MAG: IstB-like ATP-binding protein [Candidatus Gallionella acididurans]